MSVSSVRFFIPNGRGCRQNSGFIAVSYQKQLIGDRFPRGRKSGDFRYHSD
jgi:hypothetical protein